MAGVNGVNNAILVEGNPIGQVMFFGPGAGSGPTASAVVADILNIAGIQSMSDDNIFNLDPLLSAKSWRNCHIAEKKQITKKNYIRLIAKDSPGVIGEIGTIFGEKKISIEFGSIPSFFSDKYNSRSAIKCPILSICKKPTLIRRMGDNNLISINNIA